MQVRIFPCNKNKMPLLDSDWKGRSTNDPNQIKQWTQQFNGSFYAWGIPCGKDNGFLVLDVDAKDGGLETAKSLVLPPTLSQKTPGGGIHYIYKYPLDGHTYGNRVKFKPGLDIRGEGGYIVWYGGDNTPIAEAPEWLKAEAIKTRIELQGDVPFIDPLIAQTIVNQACEAVANAPQGESNDTLNREAFKLGQLVASKNITREVAEGVLFKAAKQRGKPEAEAKATIRSGLNAGLSRPLTTPFTDPAPLETSNRWTPRKFTRHDLLNSSHLKRPQLFKDWSTEDIHITTADGGTGKTTLKLFEAICLALGRPFLGFANVQRGKTLFITGEDTSLKLAAMLGKIVTEMGITSEQDIDTILESIVVKKDADLCLILRDKQGFMHPNAEAMARVLEAVEDIKPKMIVFDPISSFWGSEAALNDMAKAVSRFMGHLVDQSGACVEMINHMGKVSSKDKDMSQFAGRGGTGLPSHSRVSRVLRAIFDEEFKEMTGQTLGDGESAMLCNVSKFSDGSPLFNKPFVILRRGYLFERILVTEEGQKAIEKQGLDTERVFEFILEARRAGKYPTLPVVQGYFMTHAEPIQGTRVKRALSMLQFQAADGRGISLIDHPDLTVKEKAYICVDASGSELLA